MDFWATMTGAAVGVVAGVLIQYLFTLLLNSRLARAQKNALRKELEYDRAVVAELKTELDRLRNAVNGNVLAQYYGHLGMGRAFFAQTVAMATAGKLYEFFSVDDLKQLQGVMSLLNGNTEVWVNAEIKRRKQEAATPQYNHAEAVNFVDYLSNQLVELDGKLMHLIRKIS
jgi:hypothetical protein